MAADRDEQRILSHDQLVAFLQGPEGRMLLREQSNDALNHFLPRVGWSIETALDQVEIQQDTSHLRWMRKTDVIGEIRKRLSELEAGFEMHKNLQEFQHKQNQEKLDQIKAAVDTSSAERSDIKKDISDTKRIVIAAVITALVAVVAYFLVTHGLPGAR
jgi:Sec-independent protein translocase protein TatA